MEPTKEPTKNPTLEYWVITGQGTNVLPLTGGFVYDESDKAFGVLLLDDISKDALRGFTHDLFCDPENYDFEKARLFYARFFAVSHVMIEKGAAFPFHSFRWEFREPFLFDDFSGLFLRRRIVSPLEFASNES